MPVREVTLKGTAIRYGKTVRFIDPNTFEIGRIKVTNECCATDA
jgi:hypothetical protein